MSCFSLLMYVNRAFQTVSEEKSSSICSAGNRDRGVTDGTQNRAGNRGQHRRLRRVKYPVHRAGKLFTGAGRTDSGMVGSSGGLAAWSGSAVAERGPAYPVPSRCRPLRQQPDVRAEQTEYRLPFSPECSVPCVREG